MIDDPDITHNNKLAKIIAFYAYWKFKDMEEQALEEEALIAR